MIMTINCQSDYPLNQSALSQKGERIKIQKYRPSGMGVITLSFTQQSDHQMTRWFFVWSVTTGLILKI